MTEEDRLRIEVSEKNKFITQLMNELRDSYNKYEDILDQFKIIERQFSILESVLSDKTGGQ